MNYKSPFRIKDKDKRGQGDMVSTVTKSVFYLVASQQMQFLQHLHLYSES